MDQGTCHRQKTRSCGSPRKIGEHVRRIILRIARENSGWGYLRIVGELLKLRCPVGKTSVRRILREEGVYPEPRPGRHNLPDYQPWRQFIKVHLNTLVACDFFCKRVWTLGGRRDAYCLLIIHLGTRKAWVSSATYHPNEGWVKQQARNVLMWLEDAELQATHLIHDRDTKFTIGFDHILATSGIRIVKSPVMVPNANAFAEAWIGSIKRECLNHFACFSLKHVDHIVQIYTEYYNVDRPHQSKGNQTLEYSGPTLKYSETTKLQLGQINCRQRLGGLLKSYSLAA